MKINGRGVRIGVTVLALAVGLLAIPTLLEAQRAAAGISRVGWLEVCRPGPQHPNFDIFPGSPSRTRLRRGAEPRCRAAICRLPIRSDAKVSG